MQYHFQWFSLREVSFEDFPYAHILYRRYIDTFYKVYFKCFYCIEIYDCMRIFQHVIEG